MKNVAFNIKHLQLYFAIGILLFLSPQSSIIASDKFATIDSPGERWGHVFIYDPAHNQILLFGGTKERGVFLNDTWVWRNEKWTKIDVPGPSPRGFCTVTFHEGRNTIVLHGGRGNNKVTYSDLWEWNGNNWIQIASKGDYKADHHQMVYIPSEQSILAFGGWDGEKVLGETWIWSETWKKVDVASPPKRASFAMTYNKAADKTILFGGLWVNGQYADLWQWDNKKWFAIGGPYDQSSLDHHSMIYDEKLQQIIIFGGKNYRNKMQQRTFKIDNNTITMLANDGPIGRHSFGFTYDSKAQKAYLYGGKEYKENKQVALGDFWEWGDSKWLQIE